VWKQCDVCSLSPYSLADALANLLSVRVGVLARVDVCQADRGRRAGTRHGEVEIRIASSRDARVVALTGLYSRTGSDARHQQTAATEARFLLALWHAGRRAFRAGQRRAHQQLRTEAGERATTATAKRPAPHHPGAARKPSAISAHPLQPRPAPSDERSLKFTQQSAARQLDKGRLRQDRQPHLEHRPELGRARLSAYVDLVFNRKDRGPGRGTYGLRRDRTHPPGRRWARPKVPWAQRTVRPQAAHSYDLFVWCRR